MGINLNDKTIVKLFVKIMNRPLKSYLMISKESALSKFKVFSDGVKADESLVFPQKYESETETFHFLNNFSKIVFFKIVFYSQKKENALCTGVFF